MHKITHFHTSSYIKYKYPNNIYIIIITRNIDKFVIIKWIKVGSGGLDMCRVCNIKNSAVVGSVVKNVRRCKNLISSTNADWG